MEILLEFTQHLRAFSNMTLSVRRALCSVMVSGGGGGVWIGMIIQYGRDLCSDDPVMLTLARKRCFATLRRCRGGGLVRPPPGVSKRSVVELRGKYQQIALAEYSRLVVLFWS